MFALPRALGYDINMVEWMTSPEPVTYPTALQAMQDRVDAIRRGAADELVWLLEHPPLYTAGTSARPDDLIAGDRFPVYQAGRGGQYTYHGPGQRVAYVMLDLRRRGQDLRRYIHTLEEWIIATLAHFDVTGERRSDRVGVWVAREDGREEKIAAIGVRVRGWVTFHGIAVNVEPNLDHFSGIVPCGVRDHGVTSLAALGKDAELATVDAALKSTFHKTVGALGFINREESADLVRPSA